MWLPAGAATDDLAAGLIQTGVVARAFTGVGVRVTVGSEDSVDAFLAAFEHVAAAPGADKLAAAWGLPAGAEALRVLRWLDRLAAVEGRLIDLSGRGRMPGLAQPDPGGTERWDAGQIWAHVGEIGGYWTDQLELVADEAAVSTGPVPFGRVKSDPARIAAVAGGRNLEPATHVHAMLAAMDRLRDVLAGMSTTDWTRVGRHSTLGVMDVDAIVEEFLVGHWEQHAAQLETLGD
ncbi:MAG: hypothetical protein DLM61_25650 [Pseudonocardiales bacterium]|nr:MAG: hypothetical protein DLM61_25650 [Pseudonocardiales bacterium]